MLEIETIIIILKSILFNLNKPHDYSEKLTIILDELESFCVNQFERNTRYELFKDRKKILNHLK